MSLISYLRDLRDERNRKIKAKKEREERKKKNREREEWYKNLDKIPVEEMFRTLREKGGIKSLKELEESKELTSEIKEIWKETQEDMLELSMNFKKMRYLYDMSHLYFIPFKLISSWDRDLNYFLAALSRLNDINSFYEVNALGRLYYLNPLNEPVDSSHDN